MVIGRSFSRTHLVVLVGAAFCILVSANAQAGIGKGNGVKQKPKSEASAPALKIQNTETFFSWYIRRGGIYRSEFETEQQFKKRLSWFDPEKIVYFRLDSTDSCDLGYSNQYTTADYSVSAGRYKYDVDSQLLTVIAGECGDYGETRIPRETMTAQTLILVLEDKEELGTYTGTNAYGARVKVDKSLENRYTLNISNIDECPDTVCEPPVPGIEVGHNTRFRIAVALTPQEAKKLSNRLQIVLGVKLMGHDRSISYKTLTLEPTIDRPYDASYYDNIIDARVARVLLMDRVTGRVLTEEVVPTTGKALGMNAAATAAIEAFEVLGSVTKCEVSRVEYRKRVVDAKIALDRFTNQWGKNNVVAHGLAGAIAGYDNMANTLWDSATGPGLVPPAFFESLFTVCPELKDKVVDLSGYGPSLDVTIALHAIWDKAGELVKGIRSRLPDLK